MRIIAGEFRGRTLLSPQGQSTRPITDRVKQSVFDILAPLLPEAVVADLFAGTGSVGLECLSRGAKFSLFFEADRSAVERLRRNIEALGAGDRSRVIAGDLFKYFAAPRGGLAGLRPPTLPSPGVPGEGQNARGGGPDDPPIDIAFLDPPYRFLTESAQSLQRLAEGLTPRLAPEGIVVFRHDAGDRLSLPGLNIVDQREYGSMTVEFLKAIPAINAHS